MGEDGLFGFLSMMFEDEEEEEDEGDCDFRAPHEKGAEEWERESRETRDSLLAISKAPREP